MRAVLAACFFALCSLSSVSAEPKFPPLTGRIVDEARIFSAEDRQQLEATLKELEGKSSDQIVVYTTPSLQGYEIEDFGYRLGRFWKIGQAGVNNGIVLIVAPNERKVRIEVGRGLEPIMTDALSSTIIQNAILPGFRRGDFPASSFSRRLSDNALTPTRRFSSVSLSLSLSKAFAFPDFFTLVVHFLFRYITSRKIYCPRKT